MSAPAWTTGRSSPRLRRAVPPRHTFGLMPHDLGAQPKQGEAVSKGWGGRVGAGAKPNLPLLAGPDDPPVVGGGDLADVPFVRGDGPEQNPKAGAQPMAAT